MNNIDSLKESSFASLFDWESIEKCGNQHFITMMTYVCGILTQFNELCKDFVKLTVEKNIIDEKYEQLLMKSDKSDTCDKCTKLQGKLNNQSKQIKEIIMKFEQNNTQNTMDFSNKNTFNEMQTDIVGKQNSNVCSAGKIVHNNDDLSEINKLTHKNEDKILPSIENSIIEHCPVNIKTEPCSMDYIEEIFAEEQSSPVLVTRKSSKISKEKFESSLNNLNIDEDGYIDYKSPSNKENTRIQLSPSVLSNIDIKNNIIADLPITIPKKSLSFTSIEIKKEDNIIDTKKKSRKLPVLDVSQTNCTSNRKVKNKSLKQSRLRFKNSKAKLSLDISKANEFLGGVRSSPSCTDYRDDSSENDFKISKTNEHPNNISDTIDESPSCISYKQIQKNRIRLKTYKNLNEKSSHETVKDDDETMIFTVSQEYKSPKKGIDPVEQAQNSKRKSKSPKDLQRPLSKKNCVLDVVYKEEPLRKKKDKINAPGWSCKKCEDFYSVAFKGNEELIKKKINECSKHRGKFNPERNNTPPGFWDVNMPQSPNTNI